MLFFSYTPVFVFRIKIKKKSIGVLRKEMISVSIRIFATFTPKNTPIMLKKLVFALLLLLPPCMAAAQPPDEERIRDDIFRVNSGYYYPNLMARYMLADTTLTLDDYRHLYYGYVHSADYLPMEHPFETDTLLSILSREPSLEELDYRRIVHYGKQLMLKEPFNPAMINLMTYAYGKLGEDENELRSYRRFTMLMQTILSSGDGLTEDTPWHILYFGHAQDVMDYLERPFMRPMIISRTVEYYPLVQRQGNVRGYYFDYGRVYLKKPEQTLPRRRTWQLNGMDL